MSFYINQKGEKFYGLDNNANKLGYTRIGDDSSLGQEGMQSGISRFKKNARDTMIGLSIASAMFRITGAFTSLGRPDSIATSLLLGGTADALFTKTKSSNDGSFSTKSGLGLNSLKVFDNSKQIAEKNAEESKKYIIKDKTAKDIKSILGINSISKVEDWMIKKGETLNKITQDVKTKSWGKLKKETFYWNETTDFNLARYGYEAYASKLKSFGESVDWLNLQDLSNVNDNVIFAEIKDNKGQDVERQQRDSQMNNYFGEYAISTQ